jgi:hypothetical protein
MRKLFPAIVVLAVAMVSWIRSRVDGTALTACDEFREGVQSQEP